MYYGTIVFVYMEYEKKIFDLPDISGLSPKQLEVHLKLYEGYVNNINTLYRTLETLQQNQEDTAYATSEVRRRIGFELGGIRNHEYYFEQLEHGATMPPKKFQEAVAAQFGTFSTCTDEIAHVAKTTRGIGWVMLMYDTDRKRFHILFVSDHEVGMVSYPILFALDMWEHAYMVDMSPQDKGLYVEDYLSATNWEVVAKRFDALAL